MHSLLRHLLISITTVAIATTVTLALKYTIDWTPFVLLYAAVGISAWYGGLGWGLFSAGLAATGLQFLILNRREAQVTAPDYAPVMVLFACLSVTISYLATFRKQADLRRLELLERERGARENAERLGKLKDDFLATVSHELRTPLSSILGWVQLLRNGSIVEGRREQALATIERSAQSQMRLIDDLLDMARIIAGKLQLELHPTDLFWIIQEAIETVQVAAAAKKIELVVDGHRGDAIAYCDPGRMLQVICNLLSNAIKFTPANGRISVSLTTAENWATTKIADTGVGIAPELLPTVFERFRQGDSIRRDRQSGLGLGLALALELVERQGGTLTAESAGNGLGATFTVRMSLAEPPVRPVA